MSLQFYSSCRMALSYLSPVNFRCVDFRGSMAINLYQAYCIFFKNVPVIVPAFFKVREFRLLLSNVNGQLYNLNMQFSVHPLAYYGTRVWMRTSCLYTNSNAQFSVSMRKLRAGQP